MRSLTTFLFALLLGLFGATDMVSAQNDTVPEEPEVIGVFMHADWCGGCKKLKPKLKAVKPRFKNKPVLFTGFEKTNDFTKEQSRMLASQMGLMQLYKDHKGKTAYVVLVDADTKEELDILKYRESKQELENSIVSALKSR